MIFNLSQELSRFTWGPQVFLLHTDLFTCCQNKKKLVACKSSSSLVFGFWLWLQPKSSVLFLITALIKICKTQIWWKNRINISRWTQINCWHLFNSRHAVMFNTKTQLQIQRKVQMNTWSHKLTHTQLDQHRARAQDEHKNRWINS